MIVDAMGTHVEHVNISKSTAFLLQELTSDSLVFILLS